MAKAGCGPLAALMIFIFVILMGVNEGVGFYYSNCDEDNPNFFNCLLDEFSEEDEEEEPEEGTVVATGVYDYKGNAINVTMSIPLVGGTVTGSVSGTCEGMVKATSQAGGSIGGNMSGVCSVFLANIPAGATFNGSINKSAKTVSITFNGSGGGFKHEGSMTLIYK